MVSSTTARVIATGPAVATFVLILGFASSARAQSHGLDEMSLDRWAKMREVERHQMQIAEKYYREKSWKVAADEYDKYLTLYESSDAAPHALLKWSLCQVELRKQNTAINDGFRSVVDYWPDSDDAVAASYYIGRTLKAIGQTKKAKPALAKVVSDYPDHLVAVYALVHLAELAKTEGDDKARREILRKLTFDAKRTKQTESHCVDASIQLASQLFERGSFDEAVESLATTYDRTRIADQVVERSRGALSKMIAAEATHAAGQRLASQLIAYLKSREADRTNDTGEDAEEEAEAQAKRLWYRIAEVQRTARQDDQVLQTFDQMAKRFGADDELLGRIADWHKSQKQYDKARGAYRRFEDSAEGLARVAASYREEQNIDSAVATYEQLISQDSDNAFKWQGEIAMTLRQAGRRDDAVEIYRQLMQKDIENSARWLWEVAATLREAGQWAQAIGYFRQSDRFPDNYREMASCHRKLKQPAEAVILYNQIAGGHAASAPWAMLQVGYTLEEAENPEGAIAAFKGVCRQFPKDGHAGIAHAHLQNKYKLSVTLGGAKE